MIGLFCVHYFDDYIFVCPSVLTGSTKSITDAVLLSLLGWQIKNQGAKALPFSKVFAALGRTFIDSAKQALAENPKDKLMLSKVQEL